MPSRSLTSSSKPPRAPQGLFKEKNASLLSPERLTNRTDAPFILSFKYPLAKGYTFSDMSLDDVKAFQRFLDKVSQMTVQQVDKLFRRQTDCSDFYEENQVQHYEVSKKFRIHVILENGRYKVIRLDPNHKFHK